jgi:hypothetical protein
VQVAGEDGVVAALAVQREALDRPRPDPRDRPQPPPAALVVGREQVHAPGGDLPRAADERDGAAGREVERLQQRRRLRGEGRRRGEVAQPGALAPTAEPEDDAALDRGRPPVLDELLADRPGQGLERVGAAGGPQPRRRAHDGPDHRVVAEAGVERRQVVVEPEGEAHAPQRLVARLGAGALRTEDDPVRGRLGRADDDRLAADVDEPLEHPVAPAQHAVHATALREPEGPSRAHLDPSLDHRHRTLRPVPDDPASG